MRQEIGHCGGDARQGCSAFCTVTYLLLIALWRCDCNCTAAVYDFREIGQETGRRDMPTRMSSRHQETGQSSMHLANQHACGVSGVALHRKPSAFLL